MKRKGADMIVKGASSKKAKHDEDSVFGVDREMVDESDPSLQVRFHSISPSGDYRCAFLLLIPMVMSDGSFDRCSIGH